MPYMKKVVVPLECLECKCEFTPKIFHPRYKFCSDICKDKYNKRKAKESGRDKTWKVDNEKRRVRERTNYRTKEGLKESIMSRNASRRSLQYTSKVLFDEELTHFVFQEAHSLRLLRNELTKIEWHVDHIVPLKGEDVCGLHIWNNFAVIPKVDNLRKGNRLALYH